MEGNSALCARGRRRSEESVLKAMPTENGKTGEPWAVAMLGDAQFWIPLVVLLGGIVLLGIIQ